MREVKKAANKPLPKFIYGSPEAEMFIVMVIATEIATRRVTGNRFRVSENFANTSSDDQKLILPNFNGKGS